MSDDDIRGRAGGKARAGSLSPAKLSEIARKAARARWGAKATHKGNFQRDFGIDVECYVLDDENRTAVISQRGMGEALGFPKEGSGKQFLRSVKGAKIAPYLGDELVEKLDNPIVFQGVGTAANTTVHGYDVTMLIDVCKAIIKAEADGKLLKRQANLATQAHIIVGASAKAGIKGLVYALAGYNPAAEEVIAAFKLYIQEEARKYEPEFPNELYMQWYRLYGTPVLERGKPWHFKYLTVRHIYHPLAKSSGKIYELLKVLKAKDGDRQKKLFQFLNEIGARALRMHLGRVLEMAESSSDRYAYENKVVERFGGQHELDLVIPDTHTTLPPPGGQTRPDTPAT
ncbi:P63C domain-containing protein [Inquilinus sp. OTU3971]|uniref:P63C domain-containing protein n=1 Tax=Inquilinus sp. OTU3971 TaxID=3043855 RepID=UPI00313DB971